MIYQIAQNVGRISFADACWRSSCRRAIMIHWRRNRPAVGYPPYVCRHVLAFLPNLFGFLMHRGGRDARVPVRLPLRGELMWYNEASTPTAGSPKRTGDCICIYDCEREFLRVKGINMKIKIALLCLLLFLISFPIAAFAELYQPETNWKAEWITVDELPNPAPANLWLAFRKEISLEKIPDGIQTRALCRIACDSKYWLYVNGKMIVFEGQLKRGPTPQDTYFDVVDLSQHLKPGKNQIAVLMWYFGKHGFSHKSSGVPGFLFDASTNGLGGLELL
ncbi:MAG: hypothetical protein LBQ66_14640, partial [Planctomycetaceae bacterium]|nr:hypothetical protein [Planctomycetaceae bacterium]